jgi:hypothetical protein
MSDKEHSPDSERDSTPPLEDAVHAQREAERRAAKEAARERHQKAMAEAREEQKAALKEELKEARSDAERAAWAGGFPPPMGPHNPLAERERFEDGRHVRDVRLTRTRTEPTVDRILWVLIRDAANRISFPAYQSFMDRYLEHLQPRGPRKAYLPFTNVQAYALLKAGTETFLETHCGIIPPFTHRGDDDSRPDFAALGDGSQLAAYERFTPDEMTNLWRHYSVREKVDSDGDGRRDGSIRVLPYLDIVRRKLGELDVRPEGSGSHMKVLMGLIQERLQNPPMIELIWSYWHEEAMLAQSLAAISRRFQNVRANGRDPLANLELDALRPLNNVLWGYIQDEQHRLNVVRRAYEYDHHYGFSLDGKAIKNFRPADSRSRFLEAFHNLLSLANEFYKQDDDTTVVADGFPLLAALKECHLLLTQGGHNQYGDLPWTARQEMLMEQWILSRPEMREFIGGRVMVAYPESWMDRVDAMKSLQGWDDTSSVHYRDLGVFGEMVLLSIRYGAWVSVVIPDQAANWARYWRPEIQGYVQAYRTVTGVDLRSAVADTRPQAERYLPPSVHLKNRLLAQGRAR